jgi:uncharacterized protein (DUF2147 family)
MKIQNLLVLLCFSIITFSFLIAPATAQEPETKSESDAIVGIWLMPDNEATIEIFKCGDKYCGKIIGLAEPNEDGKPKLDKKNPKKELKNRPLLGLQILNDFKYDKNSTWKDGKLYGHKKGKMLSAELVLEEKNTLKVKASVGFMKKTLTWKRSIQ